MIQIITLRILDLVGRIEDLQELLAREVVMFLRMCILIEEL